MRGARGTSGDGEFAKVQFDDKLVDVAIKGENVFDKIFFGIPSWPEDFMARALRAVHPKSLDVYTSPLVHGQGVQGWTSQVAGCIH